MMVQVSLPVEQQDVPDYLVMAGTWLAERRGTPVPAAAGSPWARDDHAVAVEWLKKLTRPAREVMHWLIHHPGVKIRGSELVRAVGLESKYKVAGTLSWPGRYAYAAGKVLPFDWDGEHISMSHEVAEILRAALEEVGAEETGLTPDDRGPEGQR